MSTTDCAGFDDAVAELALGTLTGRERASALAHVEHCDACARSLEALAHTADRLLLACPDAEPSPKFTRRVIDRFEREHVGRTRSPRLAALVAAVAVVIGAGSATVAISLSGRSHATSARIDVANRVQTLAFTPSRGEHVRGHVFLPTQGGPWLTMVVHDTSDAETYTCELELHDGRRFRAGAFGIHNGVGIWGRQLDFDPAQIRTVLLLDHDGQTAATAIVR